LVSLAPRTSRGKLSGLSERDVPTGYHSGVGLSEANPLRVAGVEASEALVFAPVESENAAEDLSKVTVVLCTAAGPNNRCADRTAPGGSVSGLSSCK
jgi:hypothetical protein